MAEHRGMFVIYQSSTGRGDWTPVPPAEIPEWVKKPDNLGRLAQGEMCMKCDEGESGSMWYRADVILSPLMQKKIDRAQRKAARQRLMALL